MIWTIKYLSEDNIQIETEFSFVHELKKVFTKEFNRSKTLLANIEDDTADVWKKVLFVKSYLVATESITLQKVVHSCIDQVYIEQFKVFYSRFQKLIKTRLEETRKK